MQQESWLYEFCSKILPQALCAVDLLTIVSHSRSHVFDVRPGDRLSWLRCFVDFLSLQEEWRDCTLNMSQPPPSTFPPLRHSQQLLLYNLYSWGSVDRKTKKQQRKRRRQETPIKMDLMETDDRMWTGLAGNHVQWQVSVSAVRCFKD